MVLGAENTVRNKTFLTRKELSIMVTKRRNKQGKALSVYLERGHFSPPSPLPSSSGCDQVGQGHHNSLLAARSACWPLHGLFSTEQLDREFSVTKSDHVKALLQTPGWLSNLHYEWNLNLDLQLTRLHHSLASCAATPVRVDCKNGYDA